MSQARQRSHDPLGLEASKKQFGQLHRVAQYSSSWQESLTHRPQLSHADQAEITRGIPAAGDFLVAVGAAAFGQSGWHLIIG